MFHTTTEDGRDIERAYDDADKRHLMASCPSVDALLDVIIEAPVPAGWAVSPSHRDRWRDFVAAAREIQERREECGR